MLDHNTGLSDPVSKQSRTGLPFILALKQRLSAAWTEAISDKHIAKVPSCMSDSILVTVLKVRSVTEPLNHASRLMGRVEKAEGAIWAEGLAQGQNRVSMGMVCPFSGDAMVCQMASRYESYIAHWGS